MKNIAVFASGNGSNFEAIANAIKAGELRANIALLVCDRPEARVVERAKNHRVRVFSFSPKQFNTKADYEMRILEALYEAQVEFILLAGYMRIIGETLLNPYDGRIINIHPSLLPAFPGKDAIAQAFDSGVSETGVTVHYVDAGVDTGPIIAQCRVTVLPTDTLELLEKRIHQAEHTLYVQTLKEILV